MTKRIVLITGSIRGIGAEAAVLAAQAGWVVAVNDQTRADAAHRLSACSSTCNRMAAK